MKKVKIIVTSVIVFILAALVATYVLLHGNKLLVNFKITSVTNDYTKYHIVFNPVRAADHYVIQIHNSDNRKVFEESTKKNDLTLNLTNLVSDEEYSLIVFAYDKLGDYRACEKEYIFKWDEASIDKNQSILLNNEDYIFTTIGDLTEKDYHIRITNTDGKELFKDVLKNNEYTLTSELYKDKEIELIAELYDDEALVDSIHLFNNMNPVSAIKIDTPKTDSTIAYNDFTLSYSGGSNAAYYQIKIIKDGVVIQTNKTTKKVVILSKNIFSVGQTYTIEISGVYDTYSMSDSINITMSDQIQLKPVYISNNWKYVKKGSKIKLETKNEDDMIYYTINGENPESFGLLYSEPIEINENTTLKAVAVATGKINSVISTYEINVGEKEQLKVYLSPSNQHGNPGVSSVGYTNEMAEMNDLSDYIQERLEENGVIVYRNNSAGNINQWNKDSNYYGVDLHIAIHSNASESHQVYGVETWIDSETSQTYSLANLIQNGLMSIYPYSNLEKADRGVKYANGALGEVNDNYLPFGILVEVAHHDYKDDAEWIMKNKKLIGYNIADTIMKYYQVID